MNFSYVFYDCMLHYFVVYIYIYKIKAVKEWQKVEYYLR